MNPVVVDNNPVAAVVGNLLALPAVGSLLAVEADSHLARDAVVVGVEDIRLAQEVVAGGIHLA
jgi:hypothetical protein